MREACANRKAYDAKEEVVGLERGGAATAVESTDICRDSNLD